MTTGPLIFGEVLFDCFPDGTEKLGGAPFNVAWHLQGFGQQPLLVSRVGNDAHAMKIRRSMERWGMSLAGLQQDSNYKTGAVAVNFNNGEPAFDIVDDRAYDHIDSENLPVVHPALIYHGTLALRNRTSAATLRSLTEGLAAPVFIDVNLRPPWWNAETVAGLLKHASWAKLNETELEQLSTSNASQGSLALAHSLLKQHQLQLLIVTLGENGALAIDRDGTTHQVRPQNNPAVVDTVGAGDAFSSIIILGLLSGWSVSRMLERAQQFASLIVGVQGAIIEDKSIYHELIDQWSDETL